MHMMTCQVLVLGQNTRGVTGGRDGGSANRRARRRAGCECVRPSRRVVVSAAARANSEQPGHAKGNGNDEASEESMRSSFFGRWYLHWSN